MKQEPSREWETKAIEGYQKICNNMNKEIVRLLTILKIANVPQNVIELFSSI